MSVAVSVPSGAVVHRSPELLGLVREIVRLGSGGGANNSNGCKTALLFKKECADLVRRISLLTHLFEEMRDCKPLDASASESDSDWFSEFVIALQAAKRLLSVATKFSSENSSSVSKLLVLPFFLRNFVSCCSFLGN